jgi:hypothetical protein
VPRLREARRGTILAQGTHVRLGAVFSRLRVASSMRLRLRALVFGVRARPRTLDILPALRLAVCRFADSAQVATDLSVFCEHCKQPHAALALYALQNVKASVITKRVQSSYE